MPPIAACHQADVTVVTGCVLANSAPACRVGHGDMGVKAAAEIGHRPTSVRSTGKTRANSTAETPRRRERCLNAIFRWFDSHGRSSGAYRRPLEVHTNTIAIPTATIPPENPGMVALAPAWTRNRHDRRRRRSAVEVQEVSPACIQTAAAATAAPHRQGREQARACTLRLPADRLAPAGPPALVEKVSGNLRLGRIGERFDAPPGRAAPPSADRGHRSSAERASPGTG